MLDVKVDITDQYFPNLFLLIFLILIRKPSEITYSSETSLHFILVFSDFKKTKMSLDLFTLIFDILSFFLIEFIIYLFLLPLQVHKKFLQKTQDLDMIHDIAIPTKNVYMES